MKSFSITLYRQELIMDIENQAYVYGDMLSDEQQHTKHIVQDICQGASLDRTIRLTAIAFHECVAMLGAFVKEEAISTAGSDAYADKTTYTISLSLPDTITEAALVALPPLLHEYIVWRVLSDWMAQVLPAQYPVCLQKADEAKAGILSAMRKRSKPITLKQHPF